MPYTPIHPCFADSPFRHLSTIRVKPSPCVVVRFAHIACRCLPLPLTQIKASTYGANEPVDAKSTMRWDGGKKAPLLPATLRRRSSTEQSFTPTKSSRSPRTQPPPIQTTSSSSPAAPSVSFVVRPRIRSGSEDSTTSSLSNAPGQSPGPRYLLTPRASFLSPHHEWTNVNTPDLPAADREAEELD